MAFKARIVVAKPPVLAIRFAQSQCKAALLLSSVRELTMELHMISVLNFKGALRQTVRQLHGALPTGARVRLSGLRRPYMALVLRGISHLLYVDGWFIVQSRCDSIAIEI